MYTLGTASCGSKLATRHLEAHDIIYNSSLMNLTYVGTQEETGQTISLPLNTLECQIQSERNQDHRYE